MEIGKTLRVTTRGEWRDWLVQHHTTEREIWLVNPKKTAGEKRLPYNDAVEEALCFGWIDSTNKTLDATHNVQRYTPRRPGSPLSAMNLERIRRLDAEGRMTPAGHAAIGNSLSQRFEVPADILAALQADAETWINYQAFPQSYHRIRVGFIDAARSRPEVFATRLRYFLKLTKQNKRYGMVQ